MTLKKSRLLPTPGGLKDLDKTERTILDYAKALPTQPDVPDPNIIQNIQKGK